MPREPVSIRTKTVTPPEIKKFEPKKITPKKVSPKRRYSFKKIDFHQHIHDSANINEYFNAMKLFDVEKGVVLALRDIRNGNAYKENNDFLLKLQKWHPTKIISFTTIQEEDSNSAEILKEDVVLRRSRGLKLIGWHKQYIEKYNFLLTHSNMYKLYKVCEQHGLPLLIHVRLSHNEKYYGDLAQILSDFKNLKIILAHAGVTLDNLTRVDHLMEENPNLYIDLSFYGGYHEYAFNQVSRNRDSLRDLILKYQDQVLWGTDVYPSRGRGYNYIRDALKSSIDLVEKETFVCPSFKKKNRLRGLGLPGNVLSKIYYKNAKDLLKLK